MQATTTVRQTRPGQFKQMIVTFGLLGSLVVGAAAMTLADALPLTGGSDTQAVTAPQITSDELYTFESSLAGAQVDGWQATVAHMTSDEAWAVEASLVATAIAHQKALTNQLTPAQLWAIEQSQVVDSSSERPSGLPAGRPTDRGLSR